VSGSVPPAIDWSRPWLAPYHTCGERTSAAVAAGASVAEALQAELERDSPAIRLKAGRLRFVPAAALPPGMAYESHIAASACVPTRDNLHDLFNGLVWLHHPALKRQLNEWHAAEIERRGIAAERGAIRDALTLFDENGALLSAPSTLVDALRARDWPSLFVERRAEWQHASLTLFGHALLEKLVSPRKPITAHVLIVDEGRDPFAGLGPQRLADKPFLPLPVLGVPGWWPANTVPGFYDDPEVFRPIRSAGSHRSTGSARRCRS